MSWFHHRNLRSLIATLVVIALVGVIGISQGRPEPSNRETLIIDSISQPETLDPAYSFFTADSQILEQVYEHLVDFRAGSISEFVPELATEVPTLENGGISADLRTYTFNLRDGVTFWDGTPLTCADAEYSFERFMAMDRSGGGTFLLLDPVVGELSTRNSDGSLKPGIAQRIADSVTGDGNALSFHLAKPFPPFRRRRHRRPLRVPGRRKRPGQRGRDGAV